MKISKIFALLSIFPFLGIASCGFSSQETEYFTVNFAVNYVDYGSVSTPSLSSVVKGTSVTVDSNKIYIGKFAVTATPANENYKFAKWTNYETTITKDTTITAVFEKSSTIFAVTWMSEGKEYKNDTNVALGTSLESLKPLVEPTKFSDESYDYPFSGWDINRDGIIDDLSNVYVTQDMIINAVFSKIDKSQNYVSKITNGTANGYSFKNSADNMNVYLNHEVINKNITVGANYLKLSITGYDECNFLINTTDSSGKEITGFEKEIIVYSNVTFSCYIPLNNASVHDFSKHDLKLISKYSGQGFKIKNIEYVSEKPSEYTSSDSDIEIEVGNIF